MVQKTFKNETQYKIEYCLGEGLTSSVYRAVRKDPNGHMSETVALKILKSKNLVENWKNEFASLARVRSKYCVDVICWDWIQGRPSLVLNFINGVRLDQLLENVQINNQEAKFIVWQIYCGLKDLSSQGLFHGDLSLKNVMVDTKGKVKLIDYGLSNIQGDNIFATPGYMAPELEDTREPNLASDLFSLGVIAERLGLTATIYKSLTSEHVFDRFEFLDELKVQSKPYRLGCKVHEVLNNSRTQNTKILVKAKASPIVQRAICLGAILTISLLSVSSSVHSRLMPEGAWVSIITSEWAKINTAGQELGYTPIYSKFFPAGKHLINWKTAHGSGKMALTIRPNKNIVLDDAALGIHSIRGHTGAH